MWFQYHFTYVFRLNSANILICVLCMCQVRGFGIRHVLVRFAHETRWNIAAPKNKMREPRDPENVKQCILHVAPCLATHPSCMWHVNIYLVICSSVEYIGKHWYPQLLSIYSTHCDSPPYCLIERFEGRRRMRNNVLLRCTKTMGFYILKAITIPL